MVSLAASSKIAAGFAHSISLKSNGTLWAWGSNSFGQLGDGSTTDTSAPVQVGTDNKWVAISAGDNYTIALKSNGTLWAWGSNSFGQLGDGTTTDTSTPVQIGIETNWIAISAGSNHTVALKSNGTLWAWGSNSFGKLGDGSTTDISTPVQIGTDNEWVAISAGDNHTIALKSNGTLWAWGYNSYGQLGDGSTSDRLSPTQIGTDTRWVTVSAGADHTIALKSNGTLWAWGYNLYGQLGDGSTINKLSPVKIGTNNNWVAISAGSDHSMALNTYGTLWAWGYNSYGQLGDGSTTDRLSPTQIGTTDDWVSIDAGHNHSISLQLGHTLSTWGSNGFGQLGDGSTTDKYIPAQIWMENNWRYVSVGTYHTVFTKLNGTLWITGSNEEGQLGRNTTDTCNSIPCLIYPGQVNSDNDWNLIKEGGGGHHTVAIKSNGTLWAWGRNVEGEIGDGTFVQKDLPVQIGTNNTWVSIALGSHDTIALRSDGTLWGWGDNSSGQLGFSTPYSFNTPTQLTGNNYIAVASGHDNTAAIKADGTLWTWGINDRGQLGDGTTTTRRYPGQVGSDRDWVSVLAGFRHTVALKSNGTLWAWGGNWNGQLGDGTTVDKYSTVQIGTDNDWASIAPAEGIHTLALKSNGTLWSWGYNRYGQLGRTSTETCGTNPCSTTPGQIGTEDTWVSITVSLWTSSAMKSDGTLWAWGQNTNGQLGDGSTINKFAPVRITNRPVANSGGPFAGTEGQPIILNGSGSTDLDGTIEIYEWDIDNDGIFDYSSSSPTQSHSYNQQGIYTVKLRVTDDAGATHEDLTTANISDSSPTADFSGTPVTGAESLTVNFTNNSAGNDQPLSYEWDFDNNGTVDSTIQNPSYVYNDSGIYTVKLTVTDSDGSLDTLSKIDYITVLLDSDGDGYPAGPDCDDTNASINPGAVETCDGIDNDCNSSTSDGEGELWYGNITNCGTGECSNTGQWICSGGIKTDTCSPEQPLTEGP
ncbi:MAG: PKD domain-containing protein, partial [Nitrospirae bacterium]|nr:PKD domain-containing protein [Nitrospirota bacterium]